MSYDHINFNRSVPSVCVHSLFGTIYSIIAFSLLGLVKLIFKFIRLGRSKFFYRLSRPKPPENALDPVYGTHHMIKLKVKMNIDYSDSFPQLSNSICLVIRSFSTLCIKRVSESTDDFIYSWFSWMLVFVATSNEAFFQKISCCCNRHSRLRT